MTKKFLSEIASITSGYTFRGPLPLKVDGGLRVVQARSINLDQDVTEETPLVRVDMDDASENVRVRSGDVILVTRGIGSGGFRAAVCHGLRSDTIAASSLCIIRPTSSDVTPEYLALYLNSTGGQERLMRKSTGTVVRSLLIRELRDLEVIVPPLPTQHALVDLQRNMKEQERLLAKRMTLLKKMSDDSIKRTIYPQ